MKIKVKPLTDDAKLPSRSETGSSGYDLYASEEVFIPLGKTEIIKTGIAIEMEGVNTFPQQSVIPLFKIEDRSSMAAKGLRIGAGVVDYSYRGEIKVVMHNLNNTTDEMVTNINGGTVRKYGYLIRKGDKIAQGLIILTYTPEVETASVLSETERNERGFGSTGK